MALEDIFQPIDVDFHIPAKQQLRFTNDVFGQDQNTLASLIEKSGDQLPRVQFWIDQDVLNAQPDLKHRIQAFTQSRSDDFIMPGNIQVVPGGEIIKNDIHILERMLKCINAADLDRRSYVIVIGGGAVLDAVGFAASIAHRGIRLIRIPTTTLAQADSGVGVKSAVNLFEKKNWVGAFATPWAVVNDFGMLDSLPDRDFVCGFSEAVKVSLLKDAKVFDQLCELAPAIAQRRPEAYQPMIHASAKFHLDHITLGGDPYEAREARPLDFGHWAAHKLEVMSNFELRHGEAVAIGITIDAIYSSLMLGLPWDDVERIIQCFRDLNLPLDHPAVHDTRTLFNGLEEFRQHLGGRLTITLLKGIGNPVDVHAIDYDAMRAAIEQVSDLAQF